MKTLRLFAFGILVCASAFAQKQILPDFHADPSARVFGDTLYVYPSHDAQGARDWKQMVDWHVFSTKDMQTWTDHGKIFSLDEIIWADTEAWAPDCIERNGKYYFYFTAGGHIGVAVSDSPTGPFKDALGRPLVKSGEAGIRYMIDPNVFIDDDGQAYLYVGGARQLGVVKLDEDMITRDGDIQRIDMEGFYEGLWVHKRGGIYYASYPTRPAGKDYNANVMLYSMAESPLGPWKCKGQLIDNNSHNVHGSVCQFSGQWYLFYHVEGPSHWERRVCVEPLSYNEDGTIKPIELASESPAPVREEQNFDFGWKFHYGDAKGAEALNYDDSEWQKLDLPHDFQIEQPWDKSAGGARGYKEMGRGCYRKTFFADPSWKGRKVFLDFEGIMVYGDAWLNGEKILSIDYGYLGAQADITERLNYDGENVVTVYASTGRSGGSRWYTGGGLFRDVHLVVKNEIAVARHGLFISTSNITEESADVDMLVEVDGIRNKRLDVDIQVEIFAPDGSKAAELTHPAPKKIKLSSVEAKLPAVTIASPKLWSCEVPNLYKAKVSLVYEGEVVDSVVESFGIRTVEFSKDFGFRLNGKKVFLKGISNHHDLGALGAAVHDSAIERLFIQLKAFGYNHVRTSHNPYSESFLELADKYGILVVDELFDKWSSKDYWFARRPFNEIWFEAVPEWIKRDRNHPSVIMWSFGNELQIRENWAGFPTGDWGVTTYRILDVLAKRYDPTRKTTVAMFPARANAVGKNEADFNTNIIPPELAQVTEVASFNYRYLNYSDYLKYAPHMIIYQSEATTSELTAPFFGMDYDKMVGLAYWGAVEYWGESRGWPRKGWNYSFFNHALEPYPQAYLIKSAFSDEPLVHIGVVDSEKEQLEWNDVITGRTPISSHWNRNEGSLQNIFTYTNAEEVELFVNGISLGVQKNDSLDINKRNIIYWKDVPYEKGGVVTAIARTAGKEVARHKLETTGEAVALKFEIERPEAWTADGMDLLYAKLYAVDEAGRIVPTAPRAEVQFEVGGAATLRAVDNGDHSTDRIFTASHIDLYNGFAMAILRSTKQPGEVSLKATADGLGSAEVILITK
jgi:beta-galactosidase